MVNGPQAVPGQSRMFECPGEYHVSRAALAAMQKYDELSRESTYNPVTSPLHYYSMYGATRLDQWDEIVRAHVSRLGYRPGQRVFEAGSAAGAFVASLERQYGVQV